MSPNPVKSNASIENAAAKYVKEYESDIAPQQLRLRHWSFDCSFSHVNAN